LNCEERFLGTNPRLNDTDSDGLPDRFEFLAGSNPVAIDGLDDPDFDGNRNGGELGAHTDPQTDDSAYLSIAGYRYTINEQTVSVLPGQHCYDFAVENITLTPTTGTNVLPSGTNTVLLQLVAAPADSPEDFGTHRIACVRPRYRFAPAELKEPASGRMTIPLTAFKKAAGASTDPEVFDATRDCVVP
jgi:hypothetical protein